MAADFDALRRVQLHEKNHAQLAPVEESFFEECKAYASELKHRAMEGSIDAEKERANLIKILREVVNLRQQKLLIKAQRDLRTGEISSQGLAGEEKSLYISLIKLLQEHESVVMSGIAAMPVISMEKEAKEDGLTAIKVIQDVMQFVGRDLKVYGPFKANELVRLSKDDAALLLKHGLAQEIGGIYA